MLKIGLLGVGHLGTIHLKCIKNIADYQLVGFYDPDLKRSAEVINEFGVRRFDNITQLVNASDVVDIVTPTVSHFDCAVEALKKSKHVFIEKPIATNMKEATQLIKLTEEANVKVQVGHVERFNPAFVAAQASLVNPMFIEAHRLGQYNPRGTDVPVVLDLMIHDIDIALHVVNANVRRVHASGVNVISDSPDIASARLEFDNGAVANLTASRISLNNRRQSRFFQSNAYITVDFLNKKLDIVKIKEMNANEINGYATAIDAEKAGQKRQLAFEVPSIQITNAIEEELRSFKNAIEHNQPVKVSIDDGVSALKVAFMIMDKINWVLQ